jgi:hypothetical protein
MRRRYLGRQQGPEKRHCFFGLFFAMIGSATGDLDDRMLVKRVREHRLKGKLRTSAPDARAPDG